MQNLIQRKELRKKDDDEPVEEEHIANPALPIKKDSADGYLSPIVRIPVCLTSAAAGTWFYLLSLEGGDDKWLFQHIGKLAVYLVLSVVCYIFAFRHILFMDNRINQAVSTLLVLIALYYTLEYDLGASFLHHGEYNLLVFVVLFGLISTIIFTIYLIKKYNILKHVLGVTTFLFLAFSLSAISSHNNFGKGMLGQRLQFETEGCTIPHITPFVELIPRRTFNFFTGSEQCSSDSTKPFSTLENGVLTMSCDEEAYYIVNQDFLGEREKTLEFTNGEVLDITNLGRLRAGIAGKEKKVKYTGPTKITEGEYIRAVCGEKENYHLQNVMKKESLERATKLAKEQNSTEKPNVVIILIDSLSRAHFMRRLPKTIKVLESLDKSNGGNYDLIQLFRYHAISCCTPGNMRVLISGLNTTEVQQNNGKRNFEDFLLWRNFEEKGYVSLWQNDLCQDYFSLYWGLENPHLDHEVVVPFCHYEYSRTSKMYSNFQGGPYSLEKRCISERYVHSYAFDYIKQYMENYKTVPRFAFTSLFEAHESSGAVISTVDDDFAKFIEDMFEKHPNTIFTVMADHGLHLGPYAISPPGQVEQYLPTSFTLFPSKFLDKHPEMRESLVHNQQALTTHYDFHRTLLHMLDYPKLKEPDYSDTAYAYAAHSLFEKIPFTRTCQDVSAERCICTKPQ